MNTATLSNNVDDVVEEVRVLLKNSQLVCQGEADIPKYIQNDHYHSSGRPWSGMLDFLPANQR